MRYVALLTLNHELILHRTYLCAQWLQQFHSEFRSAFAAALLVGMFRDDDFV